MAEQHNRRSDDKPPVVRFFTSLSGFVPIMFFLGGVFAILGSSIWTKKSEFDFTKSALECRIIENEKRTNAVEKNIEGILTSLKYQNEMLREIKEKVK